MKEQNKVSVCIPAYNKGPDIDAMLQSVCNQVYNNVEVIIINNSSTDSTLEIIQGWKLKLADRGYEVVIVDRPNRECADSARTLLKLATGDYICMPDADDVLHSEYVSAMAGILDENEDIDWVECAAASREEEFGDYLSHHLNRTVLADDTLLHLYLAQFIYGWSVWTRLIRADYIRKCRMQELFLVDKTGKYLQPHEPEINLPLICGQGKMFYLARRLYLHTNFGEIAVKLSREQLKVQIEEYASYVSKKLAQLHKDSPMNLACNRIYTIKAYAELLLTKANPPVDCRNEYIMELAGEMETGGMLQKPWMEAVVSAIGWDWLVKSLRTALSITGKISDLDSKMPFIYAVPETRIIAIGKGSLFDAMKPYFDNLPFQIDVVYESFADVDSAAVREGDKFLLFEEEDKELLSRLRDAFPKNQVYGFKMTVDFILLCNYKAYRRYYLSVCTDEELAGYFSGKNPSEVAVWGCGKYGRELLERFHRLGIQCEVTDMLVWKHGKTAPNGAVIKRWRDIKENVKTVIAGASGMCLSIASLLDSEIEIFSVNG